MSVARFLLTSRRAPRTSRLGALVTALLVTASTPAHAQDAGCERFVESLRVPEGWHLDATPGGCSVASGAVTPGRVNINTPPVYPRESAFSVEEHPRFDGETAEAAVARFIAEPWHLPQRIGGLDLRGYATRRQHRVAIGNGVAVIQHRYNRWSCSRVHRWIRVIATSDRPGAGGVHVLLTHQVLAPSGSIARLSRPCSRPFKWVASQYGGTREWGATKRAMHEVMSSLGEDTCRRYRYRPPAVTFYPRPDARTVSLAIEAALLFRFAEAGRAILWGEEPDVPDLTTADGWIEFVGEVVDGFLGAFGAEEFLGPSTAEAQRPRTPFRRPRRVRPGTVEFDDIAAINAGRGVRVGSRYEIDGRRYIIDERTCTLIPEAGVARAGGLGALARQAAQDAGIAFEGQVAVFAHGTDSATATRMVDNPEAAISSGAGNFGGQFYTTTNLDDARIYARRTAGRSGQPAVVGIALDQEIADRLKREGQLRTSRIEVPPPGTSNGAIQFVFEPGAGQVLNDHAFFFRIE